MYWNDLIVRQFYATMEIDTMNDKIEWMTSKRRYSANFDEFATTNELDNNFFANSIILMRKILFPQSKEGSFMNLSTLRYQ